MILSNHPPQYFTDNISLKGESITHELSSNRLVGIGGSLIIETIDAGKHLKAAQHYHDQRPRKCILASISDSLPSTFLFPFPKSCSPRRTNEIYARTRHRTQGDEFLAKSQCRETGFVTLRGRAKGLFIGSLMRRGIVVVAI